MFLVMISAVLFSGMLSSCSKDEDFESNLAGTWYNEEYTLKLESNGTGERFYDDPYDSKDDITESFIWQASGDIISFTYQKEENGKEYPVSSSMKYKLDGEYLIMFDDFKGKTVYEVWSRKNK